MKAIVLKPFKDKKTNTIYKKGQTFEAPAERIKEINNAIDGTLEVLIESNPELLNLEVQTETIIKKRTRNKKA